MDENKKKLVIAGVLIVVAIGAIGAFFGTGGGTPAGVETVEYGKTPPPDSAAVPGGGGIGSGSTTGGGR